MKSKLCYLFIFISLALASKANDSTELYKKRVEKLKQFSDWLSNETKEEKAIEGIYYQYDSAANKNWKTFDKAIELFFNKHVLDSIIADTNGQNNIFSPEFKSKMLKGFISRYNDLSHRISIDSINFKPMGLNDIAKENEMQAKNTIIQYFTIEGQTFDYLYFVFEGNSTKLISMTVSEPMDEEGKFFLKYYQNLKKKN